MIFTWRQSHFIIRNIENSENNIFITFDDGPEPAMSPQVLDVLARENVKATFFSVGQKIRANPDITKRIIAEGHQILSHSADHGYGNYLSGKKNLKKWIIESIDDLQQQLGQKVWGFRPPYGILNLPLVEIAEELKLPVYLWNHRFFDTQRKWTSGLASKSTACMQSGDIILLHDQQKQNNLSQFLLTLEEYIQQLKNRGFAPAPISSEFWATQNNATSANDFTSFPNVADNVSL